MDVLQVSRLDHIQLVIDFKPELLAWGIRISRVLLMVELALLPKFVLLEVVVKVDWEQVVLVMESRGD